MNNNVKSATTAGLLGIFLGGIGVHDFYLGDKKKGIIHVCMAGAGILLSIIASVIPVLSLRAAITMAWLLTILGTLAAAASAASWIWGLVDGIRILVAGDAGLARRGIPVANAMPNNNMQNNSQNMPQNMPQNNGHNSVNSDVAGNNGVNGNGEGANGNFNPGANQSAQQNMPVKPPKAPMDPAKKKKILKIVAISGGAVVVGVIAIVVVSVILRVDYSEAYKVAQELNPEMSSLNNSSACEQVTSYYKSTYTSVANYNEMVTNCLELGEEIPDLVAKLGNTAGVKRNKDIKTQYDKFAEGVNQVLPNVETLEPKLELYKAWHEFEYLFDDLSYSKSTDEEIRTAFAPLVKSSNEAVKKFGEEALALLLEAVSAYRTYDNMSYSDNNKSAARTAYQDAKTRFSNYVSEHKPDVTSIAPLNFENTSKVYNAWKNLYEMIRKTYQENYNSGSGDCSEFMGEVYCS